VLKRLNTEEREVREVEWIGEQSAGNSALWSIHSQG
jgi:hypothetical protein